MNIVVLGGSPKGELSVTMCYISYLEKRYPQERWKKHSVAKFIRKLEKDRDAFDEIICDVSAADLVVWVFPLYFMLCCSQYKRFIELVFERNAVQAFSGKYAAVLTTSIHYMDHIAVNYLHAICDDLGMPYCGAFTPKMYDLAEETGQRQLDMFAARVLYAVKQKSSYPAMNRPLHSSSYVYKASHCSSPLNVEEKRIVVLHDAGPDDQTLQAMVMRCESSLESGQVKVFNLHDIHMTAGCQGCLRCGRNNTCVFASSDDYNAWFMQEVRTADIIVFAGTIHDRNLSSRWRMFFDRSFFLNHQPALSGRQYIWMLSGDLCGCMNLRQFIETYTQHGKNNMAGMVTDSCEDNEGIDRQITEALATAVAYAMDGAIMPPTYQGIGGWKIFRDEIFGDLRYVFPADHAYFRRNGIYDFPTRNIKGRCKSALLTLFLKIPYVYKQFAPRIPDGMVEPLKKTLSGVKPAE